MLELDALLRPFALHAYDQLSKEKRRSFEQLLELDDVRILELAKRPSDAGEFQDIVNEVLRFRLSG